LNHNNHDETGSSFSTLLTGVIIGAAAVFLSDERNRRRIRATMDDWKEKAEQTKEDIADKAQDLKKEGLERVSDELSKTDAKVKREKRA
jgi:gas vesicle protein